MGIDQERTCAGLVLVWVDLLQLLLGLAIIGFALYVIIQGALNGAINIVATTAYIMLGVGAGLVVVSCLGCMISRRGESFSLRFVYFAIALGALGASIAATVLIANYVGVLSLQGTTAASGITGAFNTGLNDFLLSSYVFCCTGCPSLGPLGVCNTAVPAQYQSVQPNCEVAGIPDCSPASHCSSSSSTGCFISTVVPAYQIDSSLCSLFGAASYNGHAVVGPANSGSCGGGAPSAYMSELGKFLSQNFLYIEYAAIAFTCLQGVGVIASLVLVCSNDRG